VLTICSRKGCAKVLHDFNGGNSVISNFLNQMDFFIATGKINAGEVAIEPDMYVASFLRLEWTLLIPL